MAILMSPIQLFDGSRNRVEDLRLVSCISKSTNHNPRLVRTPPLANVTIVNTTSSYPLTQ